MTTALNFENELDALIKINEDNHKFLLKSINSDIQHKLIGKWVAITDKQIFAGINFDKVMKKAQEVESDKRKILTIKLPDKKSYSLRF